MGAKINISDTDTRVALGDWVSKSAATIYQAGTDGFVLAYTDNTSWDVQILSDDATPPTVIRNGSLTHDTFRESGACSPVKKGEYYSVATMTAMFWIPFEISIIRP